MEGERVYCTRRGFVSESDNVGEVLSFGWNRNIWLPEATEAGHWEESICL